MPLSNVFPGGKNSFASPVESTYTDDPGFFLDEVIAQLHDAADEYENTIGVDAASSDLLGYVRLHDGTDKGLFVPVGALTSVPIVINGNFDHFQGVSGSGTQTSTTTYNKTTSYAADQFFVVPSGASVTQQRSTTIPDLKSKHSLQVNGAASVTTVDIGQRIASASRSRYQTSLLFSAWVHNVTGAAFTPNLRVGTPGAADDFTTVTNRLNQALQSCPDNAWTRVYHVFDPSAYPNVTNGLEVALRIPSGSLVASDVVRISQFDLRPGTHLLAYVPPDPDVEKLRCLPFFERWSPSTTGDLIAMGTAVNSDTGAFVFSYNEKRDIPTIAWSNDTHFNLQHTTYALVAINTGEFATGNIGRRSCLIQAGVATTPLLGNWALILRVNTTSAWIDINARF